MLVIESGGSGRGCEVPGVLFVCQLAGGCSEQRAESREWRAGLQPQFGGMKVRGMRSLTENLSRRILEQVHSRSVRKVVL